MCMATTVGDACTPNGAACSSGIQCQSGLCQSGVCSASSVVGTGLDAVYFDNMDFSGPSFKRIDPTVDFNWGAGTPMSGIGADTFSVRWTGRIKAKFSETHTFTTYSDDGVRLFVNGTTLVNNWTNHGPTYDSGTIALVAGQFYDLTIEYFENGGEATAQLLWQSPSAARVVIPQTQLFPPAVGCAVDADCGSAKYCNAALLCVAKLADGLACSLGSQCSTGVCTAGVCGDGKVGTGLKAEYFDNRDFTNLLVTRVDAAVNFDWGSGAPAAGMGPDDFAVRWTGQVKPKFSEGYTFITTSDDGIRLWVNGVQIINNWTDHGPTDNTGTITLVAGQSYDLKLEFYEKGGGAVSKLSWQSAQQTREIIPASRLYPAP
jgi:hypothetical protein